MKKIRTADGNGGHPPEEWQQAVEITTDMVSVHDSEFRIVRANRAFAETVGLHVKELLGRKCYEVIHGTTEPPAHCPHMRSMKSKTAMGEVFFEPYIPAYLVVSVTPIVDGQGRVNRSIHVARDITELKRAEEALQRAHNELEEAVRKRTEELTTANEQLRTEIEEHRQTEAALRMSEASLLASRNELGRLAERLILEEEDERRRLAIELESDFTHRLVGLMTEAGMLEKELRQSDRKIASKARGIWKELVQISADAHRLSEQVHPSVLEENGLVKALQEECARFSEQREINVQFITQNPPEEVPGHVALSLYRIVQESLSNVAQHARTRRAHVSLTGNESLVRLLIRDEGIGFDPVSIGTKKGLGLAGIQERTRLIRGRYALESAPGKGTSITIEVPTAHWEHMVSSQAQPKLTQRQVDILRLLAQGRVAKQIAAELNISAKTVEFHKYGMMRTLGLKTVADLIRFAVKHSLVPS